MTAGRVPRPVFGRVELLDDTPGLIVPMGAGGADQGPVPIRDDIEIVPFDECRIPCGPVCRFILIVVSHGFPGKMVTVQEL